MSIKVSHDETTGKVTLETRANGGAPVQWTIWQGQNGAVVIECDDRIAVEPVTSGQVSLVPLGV